MKDESQYMIDAQKLFPTFKLIKIFPPAQRGRDIIPKHIHEAKTLKLVIHKCHKICLSLAPHTSGIHGFERSHFTT